MDALNTLVAPYLGAIVIALAVACVVLLVVVALLARRTSRLDRRLQSLTRGEDGRSLETMLEAHLDKVYAVARDVDELAAKSVVMEAVQRKAVQRVGLVRFNPFEDTGGNQKLRAGASRRRRGRRRRQQPARAGPDPRVRQGRDRRQVRGGVVRGGVAGAARGAGVGAGSRPDRLTGVPVVTPELPRRRGRVASCPATLRPRLSILSPALRRSSGPVA